ncbi:uncharacterized protein LOC111717935 [Eurytemora carolleeae]|uniref:uncharacterized protein LOC111717935 n=1 Tax=Eurytemora carolleeae TaxID=1294199 RepID=UPI000C7823E4|nr:uncharacterized protein LOC111717935 [Eurytemora carolleeae]|eukprot:XP_023349174.1 uncharacterized protein LOC111717935 [Eurytemora affinis]
MNSVETIQRFIKLGLLPLSKDKNGEPKLNLTNEKFIILNLVRMLGITGYLYLSIIDLLNNDLSMKSGISFTFRILGYLGGFVLPALTAITGQRLGPNSFRGQSDTCCWKNWTLIGVLISLYAFGILTMHIHFLLRKETVAEFSVFFICLAVNFLFIYLDYGVLMASCFLWVNDLKSKLKHILAQNKATVEEFEEILLEFSKLRYSMEVLASFVFPLSQVLAVASAYLGFTAENIYIYGSLLPSTGIIFLLLTVVNVLEDLYNLMDEATDKAEDQGLQQLTLREMQRFKIVAAKLRSVGSFTGFGFFTIQRDTLTAMLETTITYIIILFQSIS